MQTVGIDLGNKPGLQLLGTLQLFGRGDARDLLQPPRHVVKPKTAIMAIREDLVASAVSTCSLSAFRERLLPALRSIG